MTRRLHSDFADLRTERFAMDAEIVSWAASLTDAALREELEFRSIANPQPARHEMWICVAHFNHQTHRRGQLTALLSRLGKDSGVTDLIQLANVGRTGG